MEQRMSPPQTTLKCSQYSGREKCVKHQLIPIVSLSVDEFYLGGCMAVESHDPCYYLIKPLLRFALLLNHYDCFLSSNVSLCVNKTQAQVLHYTVEEKDRTVCVTRPPFPPPTDPSQPPQSHEPLMTYWD